MRSRPSGTVSCWPLVRTRVKPREMSCSRAWSVSGVTSMARSGDFAERAAALDVDGAVGVEDAEDDAVGAGVEEGAGIVLHGGEFGFGVAETSAARAHHGDDGNLEAT